MEMLINTASYLPIIVITISIVGIIILSKKIERTFLLGILIIMNLGLLLYHSYLLNSISSMFVEQISHLYLCLAMDFLWLLISFLGYLWIDDISSIKFKKKSYDNSLSWFWNKL